MRLCILVPGILLLAGCSHKTDPVREKIERIVSGELRDDTSYVYALPFPEGKTYRVVQGYFSSFSHKDRAAIDFYMHRGTSITAAREGIVIRVKQDGNKGGLNKKYRQYGNNIVIEHSDGSRAGYWHLQQNSALVKAGDIVQKGQPIALSGKTGYAAFPHLHFLVWRADPQHGWQPLATRFKTSRGIAFLHSGRRYTNP